MNKKIIILLIFVAGFAVTAFALFSLNGAQNNQARVSELAKQNSMATPAIQTTEQLEVKSTTETTNQTLTLKTGQFNRIDAIHYGSGNVSIQQKGDKYFVVFDANVNIAAGPDLYVYLSKPQDFKEQAIGGLNTALTLDIGRLQANTGYQEYEITKAQYQEYSGAIVIWCLQFGVQFTRADLQ